MYSQRAERDLGFWSVLMMTMAGVAFSAGEAQADEALAKFGLKQVGTVLVLEGETAVHDKTEEVRRLSRELSNAVMLQRSTLSEKQYQDTIKQLNTEITQFRAQLNTTNQAMSRVPRYRGRFMNNIVAAQYNELNVFKSQLQWEINQRNALLQRLKSQPFDPKARIQRDYEVRDKREALHQAGQDLRKAVDEIKEKYDQIGKDPEFKKALAPVEKKARMRLKLGPSRQFQLDVKLLDKLEAQESPGEPAAKETRKTHRTGRGRRTTKPAGDGNSGSPF